MASLSDLLGAASSNDTARQMFTWGILYGIVTSVFQPIVTEIEQEEWEAAVQAGLHRALTPDELAVMVVRGYIDQGTGQAEAAKAGVQQGDFDQMVAVRRNPVAPQEAAVAARRNIMPQSGVAPGGVSYENAIIEGDLGNQWAPVIQALATTIPTPADILQAVLQGQVPAGTDPRQLYTKCGGELTDPDGFDWYTLMFNTRGSAPTPMEAGDMAKRGVIPWGDGTAGNPLIEGPGAVSFHQAFLEGPWRNKWEPAFRALTEYFPPPRSVVAMLHNGSITNAQATTWLSEQGLAPATIQAYIADATRTKTSKTKELNEGAVTTLLVDKLVDQPTAVGLYEALGYTAAEAGLLASSAQARQTIADLNKNVNKVNSYYVAHKINRATATSELSALGLPADRVSALLAGWDIDRTANVRVLTPAQIADAWEYGVFTQDEAQAELGLLGYTPLDAWTVLSIKAKQPLPAKPAGVGGLTP